MFTISDHSSIPPYQVELKINNKPLDMEIDIGPGISLISESVLHALLPQLELLKSTVTLRTYTGEVIPVKGLVVVDVSNGSKTYSSRLSHWT